MGKLGGGFGEGSGEVLRVISERLGGGETENKTYGVASPEAYRYRYRYRYRYIDIDMDIDIDIDIEIDR